MSTSTQIHDPKMTIRLALQRCWDCGQTAGAVREAAEKGLAALAFIPDLSYVGTFAMLAQQPPQDPNRALYLILAPGEKASL